MPAVFIVSDTHFGHAGVCRFLREDGTKLRPWDDPNEMDEAMVARWNERVGKNDKVYHLGDVVIARRSLQILDRLNGDKVLIRGNHDIFKLSEYTKYFRDVRGYHVMHGMILSHIPIHSESLGRFGCNIHGHLHAGSVYKTIETWSGDIVKKIDPRYINASVEHYDYGPVLFEDLKKMIIEQGGQVGFRNGNSPIM